MATSSAKMTEEENNFCRYCIGILKVTPQALRKIFRKLNPDLNKFLIQNRGKCQHLRKRKILTESQWELLYPAAGPASLEGFDTTLLIFLLRNLSNITPPSTGWNKAPLPSDTSLGADLLRLREIRNDHGHSKNMMMTNTDFGKKWADLTMILTRIDGHQCKQDMDYYLSRPLTDTDTGRTIKIEIEQLRKEFNHCLPENIKARGKKLIEKARKSTCAFVKTKAYKHILKCLKESNVITITGTIGSGKKTLASELSLYFASRNYMIIPINDCTEISQCFNADENQVFVVNDPFGTSNLDTNGFAKWSKYNDEISDQLRNSLHSKIILTCRLQIFKNETCRSSFDIMYRNAINISEGVYGLTRKDRQSLLQMYDLSIESMGNLGKMSQVLKSPSLPLLCQISNDKDRTDFADMPLDIYIKEIAQLFVDNQPYTFILHLVLAEKNQLRKEKKIKIYENKVYKILNDLGILVPQMLHILKIKDYLLNELEGSFLKEAGGVYSFINDTVYDIVALNAGSMWKTFTIETCSREFFINNLTFNPNKENAQSLTLCLDKEDFDDWFERLKLEIRDGRFLDVIFSSELFEGLTTDLLLNKVKSLPLKELTNILMIKENEIPFTANIPAKISNLLREFPTNSGLNFLCGVLISGNHKLFYVIWKRLKKSKQFTDFDKEDIMQASLIGGSKDCLRKIVGTFWRRRHMLPLFDFRKERLYKKHLLKSFPMCISCACGHLDMVTFLHELRFDVYEENRTGNTTLGHAARFGNVEVVEYLISNNVDINRQNENGISPLMSAVEYDKVAEVLLESGANLYLKTNEEENVLMRACELGKGKLVKKILGICNQQLTPEEKETFINQVNKDGVTALYKACHCSDIKSRYIIAYMLLKENANPQTCDKVQNSSPLHLATAQNDDRLVKLLLDKTNDHINSTDKDGVTPLLIAAENCFAQIVSTLLDKGADFTICRKTDGASPILISAERGHLEVIEILMLYTKNRNDINNVNCQNSTPLLLATLNNHTKVCKVLLENGADETIYNNNGYNPFLVASRNGNTRLIHMYLQRGANIDCQTMFEKYTSLHLAAMVGNTRALKYLLVQLADMEIKNAQGKSPLAMAEFMKQNESSNILMKFRKYGADFSEFQTESVQSPRTETTDISTVSSASGKNPFPFDSYSVLSDSEDINDAERPSCRLKRTFSRKSIANISVNSLVYSDRGSIKSASSFTSLYSRFFYDSSSECD